jgi:hypothetical protein
VKKKVCRLLSGPIVLAALFLVGCEDSVTRSDSTAPQEVAGDPSPNGTLETANDSTWTGSSVSNYSVATYAQGTVNSSGTTFDGGIKLNVNAGNGYNLDMTVTGNNHGSYSVMGSVTIKF